MYLTITYHDSLFACKSYGRRDADKGSASTETQHMYLKRVTVYIHSSRRYAVQAHTPGEKTVSRLMTDDRP